MQTRRKRKADEGGAAVEKMDSRTQKANENAQEEVGSRRPRRAASKGILSAIEAAQGPRRAAAAARKNPGRTDSDEKPKESGSETQEKLKKASKKTEVTCYARPKRGAGKKDGKEVIGGAREGEAEKGVNKTRRKKALKPEDIVQMLGNDAKEEVAAAPEDEIHDKATRRSPLKKAQDPISSKATGKNAGGKKMTKKLKPDEIRVMLDSGEDRSKEEKEDLPAKKTSSKLSVEDIARRPVDSTTENKVPVYRMGKTKTIDDQKDSDIDIYDPFNPIYEEEFGPEDKKTKARRAAKMRRLAKKKEEAKIILTFGAAVRENVVPAIKSLKNLKTPMQQNRRPLKVMNQIGSLAPAILVENASSQNPPPGIITSQKDVAGRSMLTVPKATKKDTKEPVATAPPPPADFSDMASCGADAYFPSYVENETGTSYDASGVPPSSSQADREALNKLSMEVLPVQHKNYKTPAVPRHIGRRIDGKVSTPREQPANFEDKDAMLSTKELVKKCFGFDSDDTGSEMDNDSLTDISPVRGVMGPPRGYMSTSRLSTISIPDKASSTFVAGKSFLQEVCVGPYRANVPKVVPRPVTAIRGKKPSAKLPCNIPSKTSSTAKLDMPPPKVINVKERVKALEINSKKQPRVSAFESSNSRDLGKTTSSSGSLATAKSISDPPPGCSKWSDKYAAAVDDINRAATSDSTEEKGASLIAKDHDLGETGAFRESGEAETNGGDEDDDNEYEDMDEDEDKGDPGKENMVTTTKSMKGAKQEAKKSKKKRDAVRQPLISEMLPKRTAGGKGKRPANDESTDDETMAIPHQKRRKAYCKRTLNTSIGSSPVKVNKRTEKKVNEWAHLQTSHFSEVDEFDLTFA